MSILFNQVERIMGPYTSKRFEFLYPDYFPVKPGKTYYIVYTKDKKKKYIDIKSKLIVPIRDESLFKRYIKSNLSLNREVYLKSSTVTITDKDKKFGSVNRFFAKYKLGNGDIFEISDSDFNRETNFYDKVSVNWTITGNKEEVIRKNRQEIERTEKQLKDIKYFLDPLEFYEEEITPEEELQKKLSNLK